MRSLDKRVAVVTGASSGIGRATAKALAAKGCTLAIADIDETGLAQTANELPGTQHSTHLVDVSDKQRMQAFASEVEQAHGPAHIVINNAGVTVTDKLEDHSLEDFEWIVGINFWGVVYGCKFFLPQLQANGWGAFVNLSSMFGLTGVPKQSSYCATKFAVRGFSESLSIELANENIDVISVHPGGIRTNIVRNSRGADDGKRQRIIDWFDTQGMKPEKAASKIVAAVEHRKQRVVITPEAWATDIIKRLYPSIPRRLAGWAVRKSELV
ncbi:Short chain dehydrogenase [Enhygromyxa salina]|uniref:Short chain dehydrogenase n=1 Tax=Enhygromyxa salina TaxID=215803 RepID=A0A0C1ZCF1_9BACT|nr:SDR family NAD(P)-dependent oxidoreductase [Enhygromyxa salina]KIG15364.1 Short chain dehydrogenase [Enhygromyxa salina]